MFRMLGLAAVAAAVTAQSTEPFVLPAGVELLSDLVYARPHGRDLKLDLFRPKSAAGPVPAVVYVHGGAWRGGSRTQFRRHAAHMATIGFAGVTIEYRLSKEAQYPAALDDVRAAVGWVRANSARYGIDPDRIGAAGGSAGGHLVALLGTDPSNRVRAVAAFNPVLDLAAAGKANPNAAGGAIAAFLGGSYEQKPELWKEASPLAHVSKNSAPMLFLHGTADKTVPYDQSVAMRDALRNAGVPAELYTVEGAAHGFFNSAPHFQPALARMEQFFRKYLK
jgi:acetyl esterase/lipase